MFPQRRFYLLQCYLLRDSNAARSSTGFAVGLIINNVGQVRAALRRADAARPAARLIFCRAEDNSC